MIKANISLACFPGRNVFDGMLMAQGATEPMLGNVHQEHVQICPQNRGRIDEEMLEALVGAYPHAQFRLHANVHVQERRIISDFSRFHVDTEYWARIAELSRFIQAPAYSGHAGRRDECSFDTMIDNVKRAADLFGCPVAVEGLYPAEGDPFLVSTWDEYEKLYRSGVPYALDLSHLNIVASQEKNYRRELVQEMLASPRCIEIHISDNDGRRDAHRTLKRPPVWWRDLSYANPEAVIFTEGVSRPQAKDPRTC
jgi:hypothetical protein